MRFTRTLMAFAALALTLAGALAPTTVSGQGITTAAISGRVTDTDGRPLPGIQVVVTNLATGASRGALTSTEGNFMISGLQVGGPYRIQATGIGHAPFSGENFRLALGQNLNLPIQLAVQAVQMGALQILSEPTRAQVINPNRTGAEQLVTEHQISSLPTITRNFTDFIALSPLVGAGGGATSVGGSNNRFNNIQIDGAVSQDLFGLGSTGQPGGQADARSISIEAVKEYQVLAAPYDVRQSGFTGGLINAVTKSGTNDFGGSLYAFYKNESLVRTDLRVDTTSLIFGNFNNPLFGGSLGGPIIRDKLHFFVAGEFETNTRPASGVAIGRESPEVVGVDQANADRYVAALEAKGLTPGSYTAKDTDNPNRNAFARIDWALTPTHTLTLRHNYVRAEDEIVNQRGQGATAYALDSNWYFFESTTHSSVAQLNSSFSNGMFNELTIGRNQIRDRRTPNTRFPQLQVSVTDTFGTLPTGAPRILTRELRAGAETASQANELDTDSWEFTNNLSFHLGGQRITVGIHDEYYKFRNLFGNNVTGTWSFTNLANFEAGVPSQFTRTVPYSQGLDLNARFAVNTMAVYAQTELNLMSNFKVTAGLRYDHPTVLDKPANNPLFSDTAEVRAVYGGRRLDQVPEGNGIISPRLGFNWDVFDNRDFQVRGGAGLFTGRHPYVWLSNIFTNNGLQTVAINCTGANLPAFTTDPDNQPRTCATGTTPSPALAFLNVVDPEFEYPSNWRFNLAADKRLPYGIVATGEFIYTRANKQIFLRELNLNLTPVGTTQGGRQMFGTVRAGALAAGANNSSASTPRRLTNRFLHVVELTNSDQDRSWSATAQLQKRFAQGFDLNASYTHQDAKDISGLTSSVATSNIGFNPLTTGHPNNPSLSTSDYETKHKIVVAGSWDVTSWFRTSLFYIGNSGDGYSFVVNGDNNADGYEAPNAADRFNDLAYIPTNQADITLVTPADWTRLDTFLSSLPCANSARGRIMVRNECTEPWRNRLDSRFTFIVPTIRGQRAEVSADIFNVLNLLNEEWGRSEGMLNATEPLLELRGWDVANNRGIYNLAPAVRNRSDGKPGHFTTFSGASRWQMQLGVRYAF